MLVATFTGASAATINHNIGNITSGTSISSGTLTSTTTFTLTVTGSTGDVVTRDVTVIVVPPPSITSFLAASTSVRPGGTTTLSANFANGTGSIDHSIGGVTSGAAVSTGALLASVTYTLTVTNSAGDKVTSQVTIAVEGFVSAGSTSARRRWHTATLLTNGKVLITGGDDGTTTLSSAELYDPGTGTFTTLASSMKSARSAHAAVLLSNGRVLITGGTDAGGSKVSSAELYDPALTTFSAVLTSMTTARAYHTATLIPSLGSSGMVLIAGGDSGNPSTAELFDPASSTFAVTSDSMSSSYAYGFTATTLDSGNILFVGTTTSSEAELYTPSTGYFTATDGGLSSGRYAHTATLLSNGRVLVAGGFEKGTATPSTEIFDPISGATGKGSFSTGARMLTARYSHTATPLSNGRILFAGGGDTPYNAELFDSVTSSFRGLSMITVRFQHTATLLPNGKVLLVGGSSAGGDALATAELYVY